MACHTTLNFEPISLQLFYHSRLDLSNNSGKVSTMKLTEVTEISGKKLSKSELNLLKKIDALGVIPATLEGIRQNPYSGVQRKLCPLAVTLYDFIIIQYNAGNVGKLFSVSVWDNCRYMFLKYWPDEYFDLID
jgi:hypothetical protein